MKIPTYMNGLPTGEYKELPDDLIQKASELAVFMADTGTLSIYGIGPVFGIQRQLAERELSALVHPVVLNQYRSEMNTYHWSRHGMIPMRSAAWIKSSDAADLQRQLDEVTKERDQLRAALKLADALRNHERGYTK